MNIQTQNIPLELKEIPAWVLWKYEIKDGKPTKVPYSPVTKYRAKSDDPSTWGAFDEVVYLWQKNDYEGIGFVLSASVPYCIVDMDGCIVDGELHPDARDLVSRFNSYTERTPSGTGLRIIFRGNKPGDRCQKPGVFGCSKIEVYETLRFVTVSGDVWEGYNTIHERQEPLSWFYNELFPVAPPRATPERRGSPTLITESDTELLAKMLSAKNGGDVAALYSGNVSSYNNDASSADIALCNHLAFWTGGDFERMDRMYRGSGLMRDKWDSPRPGGTYGSITLNNSIAYVQEHYSGEKGQSENVSYLNAKKNADTNTVIVPTEEEPVKASGDADRKRADRERKKKLRDERTVRVTLADNLPRIETNGEHLRDISDAALTALKAANDPPFMFVRGGSPVRVFLDTDAAPAIQSHTTASLKGVLARCANFVSTSFDRGTVPVAPPAVVVEDILSLPTWQGIPPLSGIVTAPIVSASGKLETEPGYLEASALYYHDAFRGDLPDTTPTPANIEAAKRLLLETLIGDFPFVDEAGKAHTLGIILLPFVRPCIKGATPLHLVDAPTPGSGKSLLVEVAQKIFAPKISPTPADVKDDDEWRKRITSSLLTGGSHIWFDNINRKVDSGSLAAALTATEWTDRLLGGNAQINAPVRCVWTATGNNTQLSDELARRTVYIRLDPCMERPWDRDGFKIPDLREFVTKERPKLLAAAITLIRAWLDKGMPAYTGKPLGSYEAWTRVIGGILETAGVPGFLSNRAELFEKADPERESWAAFLEAWWNKFRDARCGIADIFSLAIEHNLIDGKEGHERSERIIFGKALRSKTARVFGVYRFMEDGTLHRATQYKCECVNIGELNTPLYTNVLNITPPNPPQNQTPIRTVVDNSHTFTHSHSISSPHDVVEETEEGEEEATV